MSHEDERLGGALRRIAASLGQRPDVFSRYVDRLSARADAMENEPVTAPDRTLVWTEGSSDMFDGLAELLLELVTGKPCGTSTPEPRTELPVLRFPPEVDLSAVTQAQFDEAYAAYSAEVERATRAPHVVITIGGKA